MTESQGRRYLLVVRRDRPELLVELAQDFGSVRDIVEIITDRRVEERRREFRPHLERRRVQRRYRPPRTWEEHGFLLTSASVSGN